MKKIYLLLLLLLFVGCEYKIDDKKESKKEISKIVSSEDEIYIVEIERHKYVVYNGFHEGGIVHAESCQCKEGNENNDRKE